MIKKTIITTVLTLVAIALVAPAIQANEVKANNVSSVRYQDPDTGNLVQFNRNHQDKSQWHEHSPNGVFNFKLVTTDEWTVYLYDETRKMSLTMDLHQRKITWGTGPNKGVPTNIIGTYPIHSYQ